MRTTLEDQDYSAGAYVSFSPIPVAPSANAANPLGTGVLIILFLLAGSLSLGAAIIATRPYQIEAQKAKAQAETAQKEADRAKNELNRIRRCVGGTP